jgi:glycine/D-amino acid oxidase-like deaminating enzyme
MEPRALGSTSSEATTQKSSSTPHEGRNVWILTAYGISGLALIGILAYYFSDFITH